MIKINKLKNKIIATILMIVFTVMVYFSPISCVILYITKIPCLGCGMTRALISALKLDFSGAFSYHYMFWSVPILYVCFLFDGKLFKKRYLNFIFYSVILTGFILNWIIRIST